MNTQILKVIDPKGEIIKEIEYEIKPGTICIMKFHDRKEWLKFCALSDVARNRVLNMVQEFIEQKRTVLVLPPGVDLQLINVTG